MPARNPVAHALNHPIRKRLVETLWRSDEPLSAERFHREFMEDDGVGLDQVAYHVRQLNKDGIIALDGDQEEVLPTRTFVLDGPNSSEAIRSLQMTPP